MRTLPHWSGSRGPLLAPTPAAKGEDRMPIGKPVGRRLSVGLARARAPGSSNVARPSLSHVLAETYRRAKSARQQRRLQSAGPPSSCAFPVVMHPGCCHAKSVPGAEFDGKSGQRVRTEKWKLASGTALCTEVSALYTKSREDGVQRGKSRKIGESAENA